MCDCVCVYDVGSGGRGGWRSMKVGVGGGGLLRLLSVMSLRGLSIRLRVR